MRPVARLLPALALGLAMAGTGACATWDPFDQQTLESYDPKLVAFSMLDPAFSELIHRAYFCSGPEARKVIQKKYKAAILSADGPEEKAGLEGTLAELTRLPLSRFFYFRLKGTDRGELDRFAKTYGMHVHVYHRSGFFAHTHHVLLSGPEAAIPTFKENFDGRIAHEQPIDRMRVEIGFKTGGNWAELVWPTGTDWKTEFPEMDAWSAAGILSAFQEEKEKGLQRMVKQKIMAEFEGIRDRISNLGFNVYVAGQDEPIFSR